MYNLEACSICGGNAKLIQDKQGVNEMTINEARAILQKNVNIAVRNNLSVVTLFTEDMMTGEIAHASMFSDSGYETDAWAARKSESFKKLNVHYALYRGYILIESSNTLIFDSE